MYMLVSMLVSIGLSIVEGVVRSSAVREGQPLILSNLYSLGVLLPSIAVGVRRMHDTGHSGWYLLIPFYNLILACMEGTKGANRFGSDPKGG